MSKRLQLFIGIAVSIGCFAALFLFIDAGDVWQALQRVDGRFLLLGTACHLTYVWLRAVRWRILLEDNVPTYVVFHTQNVGFMLTQLLPFRLGDVARALLIGNQPKVTVAQGFSTMVVERVLDMLAIVTLLPLAATQIDLLPDWLRGAAATSTVLAIVALAVMVVMAQFRPKTVALMQRFIPNEGLHQLADDLLQGLAPLTQWRTGARLLFWSYLLWLPLIGAYAAVLRASGIVPTLTLATVILCTAALSIAAPSSPSQAGVFHVAVTLVLTTVFQQPEAEAASFAVIYHALNFVIFLVLGPIGLSKLGESLSSIVSNSRNFGRKSTQT